MRLLPAALLLACLPLALRAETAPIDPFANAAQWAFDNGQEFPGATGSLKKADGEHALDLHYDFGAGGGYVQAVFKGALPAKLSRVTFTATADADSVIKFRLITLDGRCFQTSERQLKQGRAEKVVVDFGGPWGQAWGGPETKVPLADGKLIAILATRKGAKSGTIRIADLQGQTRP
jgi:hypothetical protein